MTDSQLERMLEKLEANLLAITISLGEMRAVLRARQIQAMAPKEISETEKQPETGETK